MGNFCENVQVSSGFGGLVSDKHGHTHFHTTPASGGRLLATMILNFVITAAEIIGGILSGSLSLISDALHNFSDGISVIVSYVAMKLRLRQKSYRHTFGLKRAEIFAAVINSSVLVVISLYLFYASAKRLIAPQHVEGSLMTIVALIGLAANVAGTLLLQRDSKHSLNIKSTYLHLLSDAVSSFAVLLGGFAIYFWQIYWIDPVLTILIGLYILKESYEILIQAVHILMEGAPPGISLQDIQNAVEDLGGVEDLHHIHLWTVGENDIHLEAHLNVEDMMISESDLLRKKIETLLHESFGVNHITLQFECNQCKSVGLVNS